jgi:hypothetical protein
MPRGLSLPGNLDSAKPPVATDWIGSRTAILRAHFTTFEETLRIPLLFYTSQTRDRKG